MLDLTPARIDGGIDSISLAASTANLKEIMSVLKKIMKPIPTKNPPPPVMARTTATLPTPRCMSPSQLVLPVSAFRLLSKITPKKVSSTHFVSYWFCRPTKMIATAPPSLEGPVIESYHVIVKSVHLFKLNFKIQKFELLLSHMNNNSSFPLAKVCSQRSLFNSLGWAPQAQIPVLYKFKGHSSFWAAWEAGYSEHDQLYPREPPIHLNLRFRTSTSRTKSFPSLPRVPHCWILTTVGLIRNPRNSIKTVCFFHWV